jgi:hypothetical protein
LHLTLREAPSNYQVQAWARVDDELEECMRDENGGVELVQLIDRELEERSRAGSETRGFLRPGTKRVNFRSGLFSDAGCWRVVVPAL